MVEITLRLPSRRLHGRLEPRAESSSAPLEGEEAALPSDPDMLVELGKAEAAAILHLERSNSELLAALQAEEDDDFRAAVEDNRATLARKYARLAEIGARLGRELAPRAAVGPKASSSSSGAASPRSAVGDDAAATLARMRTLLQRVKRKAAGISASSSAPASPSSGSQPRGGPGDDSVGTLSRMQNLLQRLKRKAAELEDEALAGELGGLTITSAWMECEERERKVARLHESQQTDSSAGPARTTPKPEPPVDVAAIAAPTAPAAPAAPTTPSAAAASPLRTQEEASPRGGDCAGDAAAAADLRTEERLRSLLRSLKRKAAELEEEAVIDSLRGLSVAAAARPPPPLPLLFPTAGSSCAAPSLALGPPCAVGGAGAGADASMSGGGDAYVSDCGGGISGGGGDSGGGCPTPTPRGVDDVSGRGGGCATPRGAARPRLQS